MRWSNGYLLAQKFGGSWHPTTSPSTWWTSAALMADLKGKLLAEGKFRYDNAGMSEYLSPNYLLHHILPLLNLYDFCEDAELKNVAEAMLHLHLTHLALNVHRNYILEPTTRLGGITYPEYNNTQFIPWLYWNTFQPDPERLQQRNVSGTHLVYAALSGFRPHAALESLATGNGHVPFTTRSLGMNWVQSTEVDRSPRTDFRKIYRAQEYAIGTGNNRHAPDGFYMNHSKFAITWTSDDYLAYLQCSHPYWRSDESETSWWKAPTSPFQQIALHENTAIVLFNIPQTDPWPNAGRADWLVSRDGHTNNLITKARIRFPLSMDERVVYDIPGGNERWYFLREGNVYIGIRALTASDKATQDTNFERINADAVLNGDRYQTGFVFEIGTASEYGTFAAFQAALKTHSIQVDWGTGTVPQPSVSYTNEQGNSVELVYNNNLLADANGIVFNLPVVTINGLSEDTAAWPDIEGPDVLLENSILTVFGAGGVCQVDWSGVQPDIFSAGEDGDNMDAAWEMAYFGDTLRDGSGDFDLDGYLDVQEFYADLDPTNSASVLKIVDVELDGGASTVSYLNGGTNADVFMEFRTNMMSGGWVVVDTNMAPSSTSNISIHTHDEDAGFYRLRAERR